MVNVRFPGRSIYGFEMVDAAATIIRAASIENLRQIE
jgi:hypothetical protein